MLRRLLNAVLLLGGPILVGGWIVRYPPDARRAAVAGAVALVGALLNLTGLLRANVALRFWLRLLALLVGAVVVAGVLMMRWSVGQTLAGLPLREEVLRIDLNDARRGLECLAAALLYLMVSVVLLPPPSPGVGKVAGENGSL